MITKIYHGNNSSLFFDYEGFGVLVDGIHTGRECGMSDMSESLKCDLENDYGIFASTNVLLFTHNHHDHYNREMLKKYLKRRPSLKVYGPGFSENNLQLDYFDEDYMFIQFDKVKIIIIPVIHEGEIYKNTHTYAYVIDFGTEKFLVGGDGLLGEREFQHLAQHNISNIKIAFLNPCQAASTETKAIIEKLNVRTVLIYHMPDAEDDIYNYRLIAKQAKRNYNVKKIIDLVNNESWIGE